MSCANHPTNPVAAYCRTCGKPLCSSCTRQVMGVIYCENCLAERVSGSAPPTSSPYQPTPGYPMRLQPQAGPNPALAGILAGFFPFGVGAVYCGQYAKGLAHLIIFILLIVGQVNATSDASHTILGLCIAGFYFYQLIDAIKSAKALQVGQPAPDPFGLGSMFSTGDRPDFSHGVPTGAVVLIGLGVLFLLHNLGFWFLDFGRLWPVILIVLGVWMFARRKTAVLYRGRSMVGPALLVSLGVLFLIDNLHGPGFDRTWPLILLVVGVFKLMERGYLGGPTSGPPPIPPSAATPSEPPPNTEVNTEVKNG